ncbi:MAG: ATPase, T2SS/T4P/T4SS family [Burkholderiaceae bacterium]
MTKSSNENARVLAALDSVSRDKFVQLESSPQAAGRGIPPREAVRALLGALTYPPSPNVLQIGAGAGYLAAVLGKMGGQILAIEKSQSTAARARAHLAGHGLDNVTLRTGNGTKGATDAAPFDIIVVTTKSVQDFEPILRQLAIDGQLLCLEMDGTDRPRIVKFTQSTPGEFTRSEHGNIKLTADPYSVYIELGMASEESLLQAREAARRNQVPVIEEIRRLCPVNDLALYNELSLRYKLPLGSVDKLLEDADPVVFGRFSRAFLNRHHLIPLKVHERTVKLATSDPDARVDEIERVFPNHSIERILITPTDLRRLWAALDLSPLAPENRRPLTQDRPHQGGKPSGQRSRALDPTDLVSVFEAILLEAVAEGASDVHLERYADRNRIRLRVDGDLVDNTHFNLSAPEFMGVVNIAKLRASLDISERRLPQGGRARLATADAAFDLRIQVQPSLHGECVTIRLLPQNSMLLGIEDLGLSKSISDSYRRMLRNPSGMMLVVGPTGSGKSTTLYAGLQLLAHDSLRKVITVEDPIEYTIDGIQQTQAHHDIGYAFADAIRAFLRLDPDVIMLGEIRDQETALEAVRASQTGHVLLSTLHSNDTIDAVQRLYDLQIHPNSLATELMAIMAQRLAKKICPECIEPAEPEPEILAEFFPEGPPPDFRCFRGRGCTLCNGRGTDGRVAVTEFLQVSQIIRDAIARQLSIGELRRLALTQGLITMRDSALEHLKAGRIPLRELPRILAADQMAPERGERNQQSHPETAALQNPRHPVLSPQTQPSALST